MNMLLSRLLPASAVIVVVGTTILVASPTLHTVPVATAPEATPENPSHPAAAVAARGSGMRVHLDENGRPFVPGITMPDVGAPPPATRAMTLEEPPLAEIDAPGGGKLVILGDRFRTYSVARRGADGTPSVTCVGSAVDTGPGTRPDGDRGKALSESGAARPPTAPGRATVQSRPARSTAIDTGNSR